MYNSTLVTRWRLIVVCLLSIIMSASLAHSAPSLNIGNTSGVQGSIATVPITLTNAPGVSISAISIDIGYDASKLENPTASIGPLAGAAGKIIVSSVPSVGVFRIGIYGLNTNTINDGQIIDASFSIKADSPVGDVELNNLPGVSSPAGNNISTNGINGKITVTLPSYSLIVTLSDTGGGTVASNPQGINPIGISCTSGDCTSMFTGNTVVELTALPDPVSFFSKWTGACTGSSACSVIMNGNKTISASFILAPVVKNKTTDISYTSLVTAFSSVLSGDEILILGTQLDGFFSFDKSIKLKGGWDTSYLGNSVWPTTLNGSLTVGGGDSTAESVTINGTLTIMSGSLKVKDVKVR